jgi:hypothetical protein
MTSYTSAFDKHDAHAVSMIFCAGRGVLAAQWRPNRVGDGANADKISSGRAGITLASLYRSGSQLSGIKIPISRHFRRCSFQQAGIGPIATMRGTGTPSRRSRTMDASELRQKAMHYRRVAGLVSDVAVAEALQSSQQCPLKQ